MFREYELRWWRDKGNGQKASDYFVANEVHETFPEARLPCANREEAEVRWQMLFNMFAINAWTNSKFEIVKIS